jgi:hypothetical protein
MQQNPPVTFIVAPPLVSLESIVSPGMTTIQFLTTHLDECLDLYLALIKSNQFELRKHQ